MVLCIALHTIIAPLLYLLATSPIENHLTYTGCGCIMAEFHLFEAKGLFTCVTKQSSGPCHNKENVTTLEHSLFSIGSLWKLKLKECIALVIWLEQAVLPQVATCGYILHNWLQLF